MHKRPPNFKDLTGQTFGRLTVAKEHHTDAHKEVFWECYCSCGNPIPVIARTASLNKGNTTSCGCYHSEVTSKRFKGANTFEEVNESTIKMYDKHGNNTIFDKEDKEKIQKIYWFQDRDGYWKGRENWKSSTLQLQRYLLNCVSRSLVVDHINHNPQDNRKCNLRICTIPENIRNSLKAKSSTGIRGVRKDKRSGSYYASIQYNKHPVFVYGLTYEEAVFARFLLEQKLFGEFAPSENKEKEFNISTDKKERIIKIVQQKTNKIIEGNL